MAYTDPGTKFSDSVPERLSTTLHGSAYLTTRDLPARWVLNLTRNALLPFLGTRLILLLVGILAKSYIVPLINWKVLVRPPHVAAHFPAVLWKMWERFDTDYYLRISMHGYWPATSRHPQDWAFYPLFPLLTHPLGVLLGGSRSAFVLAGFVIANVAALLAVSYMYLLVQREFGDKIGSRTILIFGFFPTAFYLSAIYSESILLACCTSCLYYGRQRRWWLAGLCGCLGALARAQGVVLLAPLLWEFWQMMTQNYALSAVSPSTVQVSRPSRLRQAFNILAFSARDQNAWLSLSALTLIPLGLFAFMVYAKFLTGDLLMSFHSEDIYFGRHVTWPWSVLLSALRHPSYGSPLSWNFWPLNICVTLSFIALTASAFSRLPTFYAIYMLGMLLLPLSTGMLNSIGRYSLIVFPAFILLGMWDCSDAHSERGNLLVGFFAAVQALCLVLFVLGVPAIA